MPLSVEVIRNDSTPMSSSRVTAAAALLDARAPGLPDVVRARLLDEAAGNPLALVELPGGLGHGATVPKWLPLTTRLERAFAARAFDFGAVGCQRALACAAFIP